MRGLGLIISLILAAAVGAAVMYFVRPAPAPGPGQGALLGGPGNGVVTCPGNASCPNESKDNLGSRAFVGIAAPSSMVGVGKIELCDGRPIGHCPEGYVGYLVPHVQPKNENNPAYVFWCTPATSPLCSQHDIAAVYCRNPQSPHAPTVACDVLLGFTDPDYEK